MARHLRLALCAFLVFACDEPASHEAEPRAPTTPPAELERTEEVEAPSPWPEEVEALEGSLERFESIDACVADLRARTPSEVAEALADLRYDQLHEDVCRSLEAARARDPERCEDVSVAPSRRACTLRAAVLAERPDACPDDAVLGGRDATCLAWASRSPALCRGASHADRGACEAVLAQDARRCARTEVTERARCEALVARWGDALGEARTAPRARASELRVRVAHLDREQAMDDEVEEQQLDASLDRGIVLARGTTPCTYRIELGDELGGAGLLERPFVSLRFELPREAELPYTIELSALTGTLAVGAPRAGRARGLQGRVVVEALEPERGGRITGRFEGRAPLAPGDLAARGRFTTFVRDVEDLGCAAAAVPSATPSPP